MCLDRLLTTIALSVVDPSNQPVVNALAYLEWRTVLSWPSHKGDLLFRAVNAVPSSSLIIHLARTFDSKEILLGRSDQPGLRSKQLDEVRLIESIGKEVRNVLLGIPNPASEQSSKRV